MDTAWFCAEKLRREIEATTHFSKAMLQQMGDHKMKDYHKIDSTLAISV